MLAAVVALAPDDAAAWGGIVVVGATTLTTFLAHVLAHGLAQRVGRSEDVARRHVGEELRDAVPILTSGGLPALALLLGAAAVLPDLPAQLVAELVLVGRIAATGFSVSRLSANRSPLVVLWSGLALAGASLVVVALKVLLTH